MGIDNDLEQDRLSAGRQLFRSVKGMLARKGGKL